MVALRLSRQQIAAIVGNDPEAIKQFETLFSLNQTYLNDGAVDESILDAGNASAAANEALGMTTGLSDRITALEQWPALPEPASRMGPVYARTRAITATDSVRPDDYLVLCDATAGAIMLTLPAAAASQGRQVVAKKTDASVNAVTVEGDGAELVDGAANKAITGQYDSVTVLCDGAAWWIV